MGTFGAMLSYMIIIGDLLTSSFLKRIEKSVEDDGFEYFWLERPFVVAVVAIFILFPMSITERMAHLFLPSLISLLSILVFMVIVIFYYFFGDVERKGDLILAQVNLSFFQVLPVIIFAFSCHTKLLPIAKDFTRNSRKLEDAIHCSVFICFAFYSMVHEPTPPYLCSEDNPIPSTRSVVLGISPFTTILKVKFRSLSPSSPPPPLVLHINFLIRRPCVELYLKRLLH